MGDCQVPTINGTVLSAIACNMCDLSHVPAQTMAKASIVTECNFSFNSLTDASLEQLEAFTAMETLILDNNEITNLSKLPSLPNLTTLWLNNNSVEDLDDLLGVLSRRCPRLAYLSLLRNPCCPNELMGKGPAEYRRYRVYVKYRLPKLGKLDAAPFTDDEVKEAKEKGMFMQTAKPKIQQLPKIVEQKTTSEPAPSQEKQKEEGEEEEEEEGEEEEDFFKKHEKRPEPSGTVFSQQRHFYSGKASEGNRFIKDNVL